MTQTTSSYTEPTTTSPLTLTLLTTQQTSIDLARHNSTPLWSPEQSSGADAQQGGFNLGFGDTMWGGGTTTVTGDGAVAATGHAQASIVAGDRAVLGNGTHQMCTLTRRRPNRRRRDRSRSRTAVAVAALLALTVPIGSGGVAHADTWTPPTNPCIANATGYAATCSMWLQANTTSTNASAFVGGWAPSGTNPVAVNFKPVDLDPDDSKEFKINFEGYFQAANAPTKPTPGEPTPGSPCITCNIKYGGKDLPGGERGISDLYVTGDGTRYVVATAEVPNYWGWQLGHKDADPGKGLNNAIYILKTTYKDGKWEVANNTEPVYVPPLDGFHGVIWPRISSDGKRLVWAEMYRWPGWFDFNNVLGLWQLRSAPLDVTKSPKDMIPKNSQNKPNITSYPADQPANMASGGAFYEPYGFAPNGDIIFSSSHGNTTSQLNNQIFFINQSLTATTLRKLDNGVTGKETNEFAFFYDQNHMMYAGTTNKTVHWGLDYFMQEVDPKNGYAAKGEPQLLTSFNKYHYANVGGWAINPHPKDSHTKEILVGVCEGVGASAVPINPCPGSDIWTLEVMKK